MEFDAEERRKQSLDLFIRALGAAPDSFLKALTGKDYAKHVVDGAKCVEDYIYPADPKKK